MTKTAPLTTFLAAFLVALTFSPGALAAFDVSYFATQRNVFVVGPSDENAIGLGKEILGSGDGDIGFAKRANPIGLAASWYLRGYKMNGPLARVRLAPWAVSLRADQETKEGWDAQAQIGHAWSGPSLGVVSTSFELGVTLRRFFLESDGADFSTGLTGGYWAAIFSYDLWTLHTEASLLAFSLGSNGIWGVHRDSNTLRLNLNRQLAAESAWRVFFDFYHLHRTFTGSTNIPQPSFVSDVSMSLGVTYSL